MYARMTTATAQPDKIDEIGKIIRDSILPVARKEKGYKGALYLRNKSTGKGITLTLWDTEADMIAVESSGNYRQAVAKVAPMLAGASTMEHYEVVTRE